MKKDLLRLVSVVENGVMDRDSEFLDFLYTFLLQEYQLDKYNHIQINQTDKASYELIIKEGKNIHINIFYPTSTDFRSKTLREKNLIRLDIIHQALLRIAAKDKRLDIEKLVAIKNKIFENNFSFRIPYRVFFNKKNNRLLLRLIIEPKEDRFNFYCLIEEGERKRCEVLIYSGDPSDIYIDDLFFYGKWIKEEKVIITGKEKEAQIHVHVNNCSFEIFNVSKNDKPPLFELYKIGTDKKKAWQDYVSSLPPNIADIVTRKHN